MKSPLDPLVDFRAACDAHDAADFFPELERAWWRYVHSQPDEGDRPTPDLLVEARRSLIPGTERRSTPSAPTDRPSAIVPRNSTPAEPPTERPPPLGLEPETDEHEEPETIRRPPTRS